MLEIFTNRKKPLNQGIVIQQEFKYSKDYYNSVFSKIFSYREENTWWVQNNNIINRLLSRSIDPTGLDDITYYAYVSSYAIDFTRELELSSKYVQGKWFFNNTYKGSIEAYYCTNNMLNLQSLAVNWRKLTPIEVIYTDNDKLDISVPELNNRRSLITIYKINLFELFFQFKYWRSSLLDRSEGTVSNFIGKILLPRILPSYLDYSLWNMFCKKIDGKFEVEFESNLPFSMSNYSKKIDSSYSFYINRFRDTKTDIDRLLTNIPAINKTNMLEVLKLPEVYYTKQVLWLPLLSRIDSIYYILKLIGREGIISNTDYTSGIKRYVRMLNNSGTIFPHNTPSVLRRNFDEKLYRITQML